MANKSHWRKAFDSPYLSSADIVEPTVLTIARVRLEGDLTKKRKDEVFNTAHFAEQFLRPGEKLKPMILNVTNSKVVMQMAGTPWIEDWENIRVEVYVQSGVRFGKDEVDGLRLRPAPQKEWLTPDHPNFAHAIKAYRRDGNFSKIEARMNIADDMKQTIIDLVKESPE